MKNAPSCEGAFSLLRPRDTGLHFCLVALEIECEQPGLFVSAADEVLDLFATLGGEQTEVHQSGARREPERCRQRLLRGVFRRTGGSGDRLGYATLQRFGCALPRIAALFFRR